jgi:hypothetical protein
VSSEIVQPAQLEVWSVTAARVERPILLRQEVVEAVAK